MTKLNRGWYLVGGLLIAGQLCVLASAVARIGVLAGWWR